MHWELRYVSNHSLRFLSDLKSYNIQLLAVGLEVQNNYMEGSECNNKIM